VLYLRLIIFLAGDDVSVDSEPLLLTDFVNLKIKPSQSFVCAHKGMIYICVFIDVSNYTYMNIYVCTMFFLKK
jgi:hypothetical protein